jgi:hypothetical protein
MAPIHETEARYRVTELVKKHPHLSDLLFKLQSEGADWLRLLEELQRAVADQPDDQRAPPLAPPSLSSSKRRD